MEINKMYINPYGDAMQRARAMLKDAVACAQNSAELKQQDLPDFVIEIPADSKNGDLASNIAMVSARCFGMAPRAIAEIICKNINGLEQNGFERVEIAGPGFINLFFAKSWFANVVGGVHASGANYGRTQFGGGKKVNVEFVSANPTGPMHLGNARGGALGDCLAAALEWAGYDVTREFYINDAGNQIAKFAKSLSARYMQIVLSEDSVPFPEDGYQGDDIRVLAREFYDINGDKYKDESEEQLQKDIVAYALPKNIGALKTDLEKYRIEYDTWFKESDLHSGGAVAKVLQKLKEAGATYEKDGAVWYKSTQYSEKYGANKNARKGMDGTVTDEDKDEVLVRANGIPTYFAADIAYHYNKFAVRNFDTCIDVWGADHHGHVARIKGSMDALGLDGDKLDIVLMQFVRLLQDGQPVRMSKRTGKAITLSSLLDEVPIDSARFFFNTRENGSGMDFDLDLAVKQDSDNPVYYVQYAHARICSINKKLCEEQSMQIKAAEQCDLSLLTHESELDLIRLLARLPMELINAAKNYEPSKITRYATELATLFHRFYNCCRVIDSNEDVKDARIALCNATGIALNNTLELLKVTAPKSM